MDCILIHPVVIYFTEYEWTITFKHNTFISVIQSCIFQFNEKSSGTTSQKF